MSMRRPPRRSCAVCADPHRSGAPVTCARCKLVHYCSKAHRSDDATRHDMLCLSQASLREQLRRLQRGLRGELSEYVGLYWGFYEARDFLRVKMQLMHVYRRIGSREALGKALDEALELLRLSRADPMAVRYVVPVLLLRLGRVQACYDFIKWWVLALGDANYSFRDMAEPYLDLTNADMAEPTAFAEALSLSHSIAFVVVKLKVYRKVWEGVQAERSGTVKGVPAPVIRNIQDFLGCPATSPTQSVRNLHHDVHAQVVEMIKRTNELNGYLWEAVLDPEKKLMDGRTPDGFAAGSKDEVRVTLDVWFSVLAETSGLQAAVLESGVVGGARTPMDHGQEGGRQSVHFAAAPQVHRPSQRAPHRALRRSHTIG